MNPLNYPIVIFAVSVVALWFATWIGGRLSQRRQSLTEDLRPVFNIVLGATLTLLGLVIGFSFSMAGERYELRKSYEEAEANAIGTEYIRADLLPQEDAVRVRALLREYTDLRIRFYRTRDDDELRQINADTEQLQRQLWAAVSRPAMAQPTPVAALAASGMNDVLNSQGYTQKAWWDRIPVGSWGLMFGIALFCNALLGYGSPRIDSKLFLVLPLVVAISFAFIADIDSPRGGMIHIRPQNLESMKAGLK
ncbi:MAG TPA: hypothetical protein VIX42_11040 [Edaphobacter sp.]